MERKMLLVVDPQIDFITGSLPVPGAGGVMDALAQYVREHGDEYKVRMVTSDWHPYRHISFDKNGGQWPVHCVQNSAGAALWQPLLEALEETRGGYTLLYKGNTVNREEYSIMDNEESAQVLQKLVTALQIDVIDVCGVAGDVCVLNTARDMVSAFGAGRVHVMQEYSPSLDGGEALNEFVKSLG